ncbi:MAG: 4-hydroxy-tetrahydrodipicolinate synthase [Chlamydiota bacterium]
MPFSGTITALVTPFKEGKPDEQGLRNNIRFQIDAGIDALLVLGTTGEGATLSTEERQRVIQIAVEEKKVPVIVNVGDLSTATTIEKVKIAETLGADGLLIMPPYYNRPSQEGLALHFESIASETSLPIILYNHPTRAGVDLSLELLVRLATKKNIIGIKDASGSIRYAAQIRNKLPNFRLFAGDDLMSLPFLAIGAEGLVSVLSNLIPRKIGEMVKNRDQALYEALFPLMDAAQIETNPIPIKAMMGFVKLPAGAPRLPLTGPTLKHRQLLRELVFGSSLIPKVIHE